jgi:AAHS family 4-hydroxybenzoate transporter-like MFS transporter
MALPSGLELMHAYSLNVEALIDEAGFSRYQWLILLLCFLVMFLDGYDLAAVAYIVPSLMEQWG